MFKKLKSHFGTPGVNNNNYTASCFQTWGKVAALGLTAADVTELPANEELPGILEQLAQNEADMEEATVGVSGVHEILKMIFVAWCDSVGKTAIIFMGDALIAYILPKENEKYISPQFIGSPM